MNIILKQIQDNLSQAIEKRQGAGLARELMPLVEQLIQDLEFNREEMETLLSNTYIKVDNGDPISALKLIDRALYKVKKGGSNG